LGSTLPTRQTLAGKAVLMWGCRISGIFAIKPPPVLLHSCDYIGDRGALPPLTSIILPPHRCAPQVCRWQNLSGPRS
jgi:hypothetical protein